MKPHFLDEYFDTMVDNPDNYKLGIFYFNRKDKRAIVPKRKRFLGWTVNFARPFAYWLAVGIAAIIVLAWVMA